MSIRKATMSDLSDILKIYADARKFMAENGNPTQWKNVYPPQKTVEEDIRLSRLYVCVDEKIYAVFMYMTTPEPTYLHIDGNWKNEDCYATIHRVASSCERRGVMSEIVRYCFGILPNIRIDTHKNNLPMQKALEKNGFEKCGTIFLADGAERLAYQKIM